MIEWLKILIIWKDIWRQLCVYRYLAEINKIIRDRN